VCCFSWHSHETRTYTAWVKLKVFIYYSRWHISYHWTFHDHMVRFLVTLCQYYYTRPIKK